MHTNPRLGAGCAPAHNLPARPPAPPACRGAYGRVYRGSWRSASVAVKVGGPCLADLCASLHAVPLLACSQGSNQPVQ